MHCSTTAIKKDNKIDYISFESDLDQQQNDLTKSPHYMKEMTLRPQDVMCTTLTFTFRCRSPKMPNLGFVPSIYGFIIHLGP